MNPPENTSGSPSPIPPPKGGIIFSASKKRASEGPGDGGLRLTKKSAKQGALRSKRLPPPQPKIPFESQVVLGTPESHSAQFSTRKPHHRGFFARFQSRRKGRHRIIAFILLPLAVLATAVFVIWLLRSG